MKLFQLKCPNCNAELEADGTQNKIKCSFCKSDIILDDETIKVEHTIKNEDYLSKLEKANTFLYKLENYDKAYSLYLELVDECPWEPDVWKGLIGSLTHNFTEEEINLDELQEYYDNYIKVESNNDEKQKIISQYGNYLKQFEEEPETVDVQPSTNEKTSKAVIIGIVLFISILIISIFVSSNDQTSNTDESNTKTTEVTESNDDYDVSMMESINMDSLLKLFDSNETKVVYFGRETCGYCVKFLPALQQAQKEYGYKTYYLDITQPTEAEVDRLMEKDNNDSFLRENYGATPMVILVKDGKMVDTWIGYAEYDQFTTFLEKNGFKKN